jgi:hypothetical protein
MVNSPTCSTLLPDVAFRCVRRRTTRIRATNWRGLNGLVCSRQRGQPSSVVLGATGGEQHDRHVTLGADHAAHSEPVDFRHHHVEHREVGLPLPALLDRGATVVDHHDRMTFALQIEADDLGLFGVVLRYKHPRAHQGDCPRGPAKNLLRRSLTSA